ncbi:MAG: isoprenyl transferase [Candidatus Tokpelaia sp.]|nr:MAG: isoprenyl transferase [Candidatus Tokpelaia sp.]KAA6207843.1 MAG: isoprenyl transferase [Candidatus Tokpelaia sp.]KAA6405034.1 isoprenyl transferase [Candidatus Tokpelaia sp.]
MMLPRHIAIIMDGNGRWARLRKLPRMAGHQAGMETLRRIVRHAGQKKLEWLTLYAFSSENWRRPAEEVGSLLALLKLFVRRDLRDLRHNNVKIKIIGDRCNLAADIIALLHEAEEQTKANNGLNLIVAFNYGSRNELVRVAARLAEKAVSGALAPGNIDEALFAAHMDTAGIPDPDLIIRTGGDMRLSNFLLWQAAYAELSFVPCFWPDFSVQDFDAALDAYCKRERRFGRLLSHSAENEQNAVFSDPMAGHNRHAAREAAEMDRTKQRHYSVKKA